MVVQKGDFGFQRNKQIISEFSMFLHVCTSLVAFRVALSIPLIALFFSLSIFVLNLLPALSIKLIKAENNSPRGTWS